LPFSFNDAANDPSDDQVTIRHSLGTTIGCFGGGAEWIKWTNYHNLTISPNANRVWCSPLTPDGH
jgi:hypothetical protein